MKQMNEQDISTIAQCRYSAQYHSRSVAIRDTLEEIKKLLEDDAQPPCIDQLTQKIEEVSSNYND